MLGLSALGRKSAAAVESEIEAAAVASVQKVRMGTVVAAAGVEK